MYEMYRSPVYTSQAEITRPIVSGSDVVLHHRGSLGGICISLWDQREGAMTFFLGSLSFGSALLSFVSHGRINPEQMLRISIVLLCGSK